MSGKCARATDTFLAGAEETCYGGVLDERMKYNIYVHKEGLSGNFHHSIVVRDAQEKYEYVTLELGKEGGRVVPRCRQFQGRTKNLQWRKEVESTFREMCREAIEILRSMGSYFLFGNNCQNFCNYFLESMNAEKYMTTVSKLGLVVAGIVGALAGITLGATAAIVGTRVKKDEAGKKDEDEDEDEDYSKLAAAALL